MEHDNEDCVATVEGVGVVYSIWHNGDGTYVIKSIANGGSKKRAERTVSSDMSWLDVMRWVAERVQTETDQNA